jgi:long-chain acyl-CoA synthetase
MEKIWLKHYPSGVPAEINPDQYQSIVELFELNCEKYKDRPAFYNFGTMLTYKDLNVLSKAFAAYLQQVLRLKKGDRLAIMLPNILQYPIVLFGALRAGLIVVNVNPLYTVPELTHQLQSSGAETIVVLENFANTVEKSLPQTHLKNVIVTRIGDLLSPLKASLMHFVLKYIRKKIPQWQLPQALPFKTVLAEGKKLELSPVPISNQDLAFLQYTGGTTGVSKGAMLTHRNIIANTEQGYAWFKSKFTLGDEIIITALPLYHIFSLQVNCLLYVIKVGGTNVLITNPRDIPGMISEMAKFKFTGVTGVNTLFNALLRNPRFASLNFSYMKLTVGGGMAVQRAVAELWQKVTGSVLLEGYGLTETSPCVAVNPADSTTFSGNIGFPLPSTDIRILDDEGKEVPLGQKGELAIKGPQVMQGYWQQPQETKNAFDEEGWFLTGDLGVVDAEGRFRILERKKDMILVSGFNVYPNEIEDVLAAIPGVQEAAVIGVPDENSGEAVKAFIVKSDEALKVEDVIQACRQSLTPYKVPKYVQFCKDLPKTNVGKILRRALRETA